VDKINKFNEYRLLEKDLNFLSNSSVIITLSKLYGINQNLRKIFIKLGIYSMINFSELTEKRFKMIYYFILNEGYYMDIMKNYLFAVGEYYQFINNYRAKRHRMGLPCRGQRTYSNSYTVKRINTMGIKRVSVKLSVKKKKKKK
jgi:small subunit ribosomal protein S13